MPQISFAITTAKLRRLFLQPKSTLICEYPLRGTSQTPRVIQTCLNHPLTFFCAKYGLRRLLPKWSRCPGCSDYTGEYHQEADHGAFHSWLVFMVAATLSHSKARRAKSSIRKTLAKFRNFTPVETVSILCTIL